VHLLEYILVLIECLYMFHAHARDNVFRIIATDLHFIATLFCFSSRDILSPSLQQIHSRSRVCCIFIYLSICLFIYLSVADTLFTGRIIAQKCIDFCVRMYMKIEDYVVLSS
jgi:hypothetical protein